MDVFIRPEDAPKLPFHDKPMFENVASSCDPHSHITVAAPESPALPVRIRRPRSPPGRIRAGATAKAPFAATGLRGINCELMTA
jgi:hypothetical protein